MAGVSSYCPFLLKGAVVICLLTFYVKAETVFEALRRDPELSKFYEMINNDDVTKVTVHGRTVTVFAPVNSAVQQVEDRLRNKDKEVAAYHVLIQLARKEIFPTAVFTFLSGGAPLYLTYRNKDRYGQKEYFVNNARIMKSQEYQSKDGSRQLLYIIDEVLEPYVPTTSVPPDAMEFLNQPGIYSIDQSLSVFASRVRNQDQETEFRRIGNHTFFLPVGATEVDSMNRLREIDQEVIGGHVIPNQVLFTRVMGSENYPTAAYNNSIKVEISLINETNEYENGYTLKIKSNTLDGNTKHKKGVVLSKIVRANIPVKNGVVHLIDLPLMIIDVSVWSFLQNEQDGRLSKFHNLVNYSPDFRYELQSQGEKTLCAPNNEAFDLMGMEKLDTIKANMSTITMLLQMHMVREAISSDDVRTGRITEAQAMDRSKKLYFRVVGDDRNRTLYVQGGGVNAVAVQADIGATDGIIHIIDRVLGMPYLTVYETLRETPTEVNETYQLGQQDNWNQKLGDRTKKFTFFAPSNEAWHQIQRESATAYKQLKMSSFANNGYKILDRHLKVGVELNMRTLETMNSLQMVHGKFIIEREYNDVFLLWEGIRARIVRPDVQATNGIIHIIDRVMMLDRDLATSTALRAMQVVPLVALLLLTVLPIQL